MSGKYLNNTLVQNARAEEVDVITESGVWEVVDRPSDAGVLGTRWVDINKGDDDKPSYRSRLVVQEFNRKSAWAFLTATTPIEATGVIGLWHDFRVTRFGWEAVLLEGNCCSHATRR